MPKLENAGSRDLFHFGTQIIADLLIDGSAMLRFRTDSGKVAGEEVMGAERNIIEGMV